MTGERPKMEIGIQAVRGGDVAGVHTVYFFGPGERIEVTHQAHGRENFAMGALTAAKWLKNQKPASFIQCRICSPATVRSSLHMHILSSRCVMPRNRRPASASRFQRQQLRRIS